MPIYFVEALSFCACMAIIVSDIIGLVLLAFT